MTEEEQHYYGTACDRCESEMHFAMQDDRDPVLPPPATEDDRLRSEIVTLRACATAAEDKLKDREAEIERLRGALSFYADAEVYRPHPHGPGFDRRDLSYVARAALASTEHPASSEEASR